ncbi:hypothetical protein BV25DRAFT_1830907 [Artomyces pyxidatus]|uniref:Uncharacterized protein n=1 Tax=Artomyces pyxidatus TaxID=48021 RepID=A0ACB8SP77_9AGAM|nr:hypothetical protein BV25DRAFT_1830907 [Artomyces pyxidatus]
MCRVLCAFLGLDLEHAGSAALRVQGDGSVAPRDRPQGAASLFQKSPLPVLRELMVLRRKEMACLAAHRGQVLRSRRLGEDAFAA